MRTILVALVLTSQIAYAENYNIDQPPTAAPKKPASAENEKFKSIQILPKDESGKDKSLVAFIAGLKKAVSTKDVKALQSTLDANIKYSFGGGEETPRGFIKHHGLDKNPGKSSLWIELESVLNGGGGFREMPTMNSEGEIVGSVQAYVAPYVYTAWPDDEAFDAYSFAAINAKDVSVLKSASEKSAVVEKVSYLIVKKVNSSPDSKFVQIGLPNGKKGFVDSKFLSSPIGYRASFIKKNGQWKMDFFIAGD